MAGNQTSTVVKVKEGVRDAAASVPRAAEDHVIKPVGKALGLTGGNKTEGAAAKSPAAGPAAKKSAAARMVGRLGARKKQIAAKGKARRAAKAARPSRKPGAGSGSKGPRRGATKGR
jgi:hypothetical protein